MGFFLWMVPRWLFLDKWPSPEACISSTGNKEGIKGPQIGNPLLGATSLGRIWLNWTHACCAHVCGSRRSGCLKAGCPAPLLSEPHYMTLCRGLCLSVGCLELIWGEERPGFKVVSKSTVEENKITSEFLIVFTIIWDQRHPCRICGDLRGMWDVLCVIEP